VEEVHVYKDPATAVLNVAALFYRLFATMCGVFLVIGANTQASTWQGTLPPGTVWGPQQNPCLVTGDVIVPSGTTLTILPGTTVLFQEATRMVIRGRLLAEGTPAEPIRFTREADKGYWLGIQFDQTIEDNRVCHASLEYARTDDGMIGLQKSNLLLEYVGFDHCDRRRIRTMDSNLIVRHCQFADMFGPDEPPSTDNLSENIWGSGIPDGGWFIIENNIFGTNKGHNDAIDFDGPAWPKPIPHIRNNVFLGGGDDALDLECDALIEGNLFMNFVKDRYNKATGESNAVSAGAGKHYTMTHNIFINSQHIAQVKDDSFLTFINNTAINISGAAIYLDLSLPGRKPGRGAAIANSIFWQTPLVFAGITDQSDFGVSHSLLPKTWHQFGPGNIEADPLFAGPNNGDYHLKSQAGRWDPDIQSWVKDDVTSPCIDAGDPMSPIGHEPFPNGGIINMGAYGGTGQASKSFFGEPVCETIVAGDINGDCIVDFKDFALIVSHWLTDNNP